MAENDILMLILDEIKSMKAEIQGTKTEMQSMKAEIQGTKTEMQGIKAEVLGTKAEMQGIKTEVLGTKAEMQGMKVEIQGMKSVMATKDDIESVRAEIKASKVEIYDEIIRAENDIDKVRGSAEELNDKYNTLLLKADNSALLLQLINGLQERVANLEKKLA